MNRKYLVLLALPLLSCGVLNAREAAAAAANGAPAAAARRPAADSDDDPVLLEKIRSLREQLREEYHKKRESTYGEALAFRSRVVDLYIRYHNLKHQKSAIPMIDNEKLEIHQLIAAHPRISARMFGAELEIYKSTDAYDYKAQAESLYGDDDEAEEDWTAAIKLSPQPELLRHRGHLYLQRRQYDKAIADFTACIKAGGLAPVYHSRALAYFRKDDYAAAADDLAQFFRRNTDRQYAASVARSPLCRKLRKRGFDVEGCEAGEEALKEGGK